MELVETEATISGLMNYNDVLNTVGLIFASVIPVDHVLVESGVIPRPIWSTVGVCLVIVSVPNIISAFKRDNFRQISGYIFGICILLVFSIISEDSLRSLARAQTLFAYITIAYVVAINVRSSKNFGNLFVSGVIIGVILSSAYTTYSIIVSEELVRFSPYAEFNPTVYAGYAAAGVFGVTYFYSKGRINWLVYSLSVIVIVVMIVGAQARNAIISLVASIITSFMYLIWVRLSSKRGVKIRKGRIFLVSTIFMGLAFSISYSVELGIVETNRFDRLNSLVGEQYNQTSKDRIGLWNSYIEAISGGHIIYGLDNSPLALQTLHKEETYSSYVGIYTGNTPHNLFIRLVVETGGVFLIWLLAQYIHLLKRSLYSKSPALNIWVLSFIFLLCIGNDTMYTMYGWYIIYVSLVFIYE